MTDYILGDLREEYGILCAQRGRTQATRWYVRQILLSLPHLIRPQEILRAFSAAIPILLLDRLWCLVYSMIPLKDGLDRAPGFLAANIVAACLCVAVFRPNALQAAFATALALTLATSTEPPIYICLAFVFIPVTARFRRVR
jgi:hypothetical protein